MSADTSNARVPRATRTARTARPDTRVPRRRVHGGRAAVTRQVSDTPVDEELVRPGASPDPDADELELLAAAELVRLRDVFSRPSGGQWAIFYNPFRRRWFAVRGKSGWVTADTPAELEKLIDRA